MRSRMIFAVVSATLVVSAFPARANSCSDYKQICLARAKKPGSCEGAWKKCMRTGVYIGPESGTNHGQAEKR